MRKLLFLILAALVSGAQAQSCCDWNGMRDMEFWLPSWPAGTGENWNPAPSGSTQQIDADEEKSASICRVDNQDSASHTCSSSGCSISWKTGSTATFSDAGTALDIGIQDVAATLGNDDAGPPSEPDGTFDVKATLVGGTDTLNANTWTTTAMESGSKVLAHGALISVVHHLTGRGGSDALRVAHTLGRSIHLPMNSLYTASWAAISGANPNLLITYDDGTLGWCRGGFMASAGSIVSTISSDAEVCLLITPERNIRVGGVSFLGLQAAAGDATFSIYKYPLSSSPVAINTALQIDADVVRDSATISLYESQLATEVMLSSNADYAACIRATTANNVTVAEFTVPSAASMVAHSGGQSIRYASRSGASGAFTESTTKRPMIKLWVTGSQ